MTSRELKKEIANIKEAERVYANNRSKANKFLNEIGIKSTRSSSSPKISSKRK